MINAEMVTAFSVFLGALFGGVVAVIAELRKPEPLRLRRAAADEDSAKPDLAPILREEAEHTNRTIWIVEKKLSEHLARIEVAVAALDRRDP
ncbi:MAG: hypothetical protein EA355_06090 [Rhodobacteraceae bacterium]|nr:MAG: hypothetical protein EA355_06090 [Paracoccaceae bacterium]